MRVLRDSVIYLFGELINKTLPFLLMPYLTRKLGVEGFGELSYYLTILALLAIFIGLSQDGALTRYYYFYGKKGIPMIIRSGYLYNIFFSTICLFLFWFIFKSQILTCIVIIAMFNSFIAVQLSVRQCQKQPRTYLLIQFIHSFTMVSFTVVIMELFPNDQVFNRLLALAISGLITFLITYFIVNKKINIRKGFSLRQYKLGLVYLLSFGFPLIFHQMSSFMKGQVDKFLIYNYYSAEELGVYSAATQVAAILTIFLMALNKATVPYYYQAVKCNKLTIAKIKKYTFMSFFILGLPAFINSFIPSGFYEWLLGNGYANSKYYTTLFLLGYGLTLPYLILVNYFFYNAKNLLISTITLTNSFVYLIFLIIVIYFFDIYYLPYALIFSNILLILVLYFFIDRVGESSIK